jgi:hypothetical protein
MGKGQLSGTELQLGEINSVVLLHSRVTVNNGNVLYISKKPRRHDIEYFHLREGIV